MIKRPSFEIAGEPIEARARQTVNIPVSTLSDCTPVTLSAHTIHDRNDGPTTFVSAGVHGDGVIGGRIVQRAAHGINRVGVIVLRTGWRTGRRISRVLAILVRAFIADRCGVAPWHTSGVSGNVSQQPVLAWRINAFHGSTRIMMHNHGEALGAFWHISLFQRRVHVIAPIALVSKVGGQRTAFAQQ